MRKRNYKGRYTCELADCCSAGSIWRMLEDILCLGNLAEEYVFLVALDTGCHVKGLFEVAHGATSFSFVPVAEIFRMLLLTGATTMVIAHNHPCGDPTPSSQDIASTRRVHDAARLLGVELADHIICCDDSFYSFREQMPELWT